MLMKTDSLGIPRFSDKDLVNMIYSGHVDKCHVVLCDPSDDVEKFNKAMRNEGLTELSTYIPIDVEQKDFDEALQSEWFMPDEYKQLNVLNLLQERLQIELKISEGEEPLYKHWNDVLVTPEWQRVSEEYEAFKSRNMLLLLKYMYYLVNFMRENNIIWGVGRGSSVASYILYLLGVHKINSIQFGLDWREFLR